MDAQAAASPASPDGSPSEGSAFSHRAEYEAMLNALPCIPTSDEQVRNDEAGGSVHGGRATGSTRLPSLLEEAGDSPRALKKQRSRAQRLLGLCLGLAVTAAARAAGAACGIAEALLVQALRCISSGR